jgi:FG-GAP repeat
MLEPTSSLQAPTDASVVNRIHPRAGTVPPWRALAAAALLSLALALALFQVLTAQHPSLTPAARHRSAPPQHGLSSLPLSAQGPISGALGADDPAYRISASSGGLQAASPAQRLKESFDRSGVLLSSGKTRLGLSLRAVGYGTSLAPLGGASPRAAVNRVSYAYPGLSEWYSNGPLGLEQGFTITRAPSGDATAPLTLSLALSGDAHVSLESGAQSLTLSHAGGPSLRYGGLRVSDAGGRTLHSWLELRAGSVLLRANTRGARYPLRIDPFIQQGEKLTGTGQSGPIIPRVGFSMALSSDGNTALIGGPEDYGKTGAAWVFTRSLGVWTQQGSKFTGTGAGIEARFGASVALSSDGNTALIGGPDANGAGQAWVFTRAESKWTQQGSKLTGSGAVGGAEFGWSVALSSDGNTALIGGPSDSKGIGVGQEERTGAAWVFTRSLGVWTQQGSKLIGNGEVSEKRPSAEVEATFTGEFGVSVALSSDGNTALIGGPSDNKGVGAAWAFTRSGSTWTQPISKLTGSGEVSSEAIPGEFGESVALAAEGNTALIGGPGDNKGVGAAWAFTRPSFGSAYTQQGSKLTGSGEVSEEPGEKKFPGRFGASVALASTGGNTALIGGPGDNKGVGAAWPFTRSGSTWTQQGLKLTGSGEVSSETSPGDFGASVALSAEGNTALIGGPGDSGQLGAAWAFTRAESTWTQQGSKLTGTGASARSMGLQGASVALSSDGNTALIGGPGDGAGAAWVFTRSGATWTQQGSKLTGSGEIGEARVRFGGAVALSADGNTALIGGLGDNKEAGAAWVFTRSGSTWTQQGSKLTGTGETGEGAFGSSVALSSDGNTALIGGPADKGFIGAVWVFTRSGSTWIQQGSKLTGSGASGFVIEFGSSVALSSDGNTALIGAQLDNVGVGAAWVFTRSESTWTQQGSKLTGSGEVGPGSEFGRSAALSADGNTALIGGPADNTEVGAAWAFTRSGSTWTQQGSKLTGTGESGESAFGSAVALSSDGNTALIGGPLDNKKEIGAAWMFTRSGSTWTQLESKLTGSGGTTGMIDFGSSVALSSEGNTALIGGPQDYNRTGSAWVFYQNLPTVVTGAASPVAQSTATLNGTVNPDGSEVSECKFEYGTTTAYGSSAPCTPSPGSGTSPVAVSAALNGLTTNTIYHFRISAKNAVGTSVGLDQMFKTLPSAPTVVTGAASSVAQTSATLNGTVNPNGFEVSACRFEYGTTTSYGSSAPCVPPPGSGTGTVGVLAALESLGENTTYHFRTVATGPGGTSFGADQTFKTLLVLGPHWYQNGVIIQESAIGTDVLEWGALTLENSKENSKVGAVTCQTLDGGDVANPVGGGAGKGAVDAFTVYDCVAPTCEAAGGKLEVLPEKLEWSALLIEEAGVFRNKLEGIGLRVICAANALNVEFHGTLKPRFKAGTAIGSSPSSLEFEAASGSLESTEGPGTVTGNLKLMGFEGGEVIRAKK